MRKIFVGAVILWSIGGTARADTYCSTRGSRTYCDDGTAYYRYGKTIIERGKDGHQERYRTFDDHTYGKGSAWMAGHGNGDFTSSGLRGKTRQVLPDIVGDEDE